MIKHIRQKDSLGCAIACAAMIVGCTYEESREAIVPNWDGKIPPGGYEVWQFIKSRGFDVVCQREHFFAARDDKSALWPPEPFADVHLVSLKTHGAGYFNHSVVMLRDGTILDPDCDEPRRMSDYLHIEQISAVLKLNLDE